MNASADKAERMRARLQETLEWLVDEDGYGRGDLQDLTNDMIRDLFDADDKKAWADEQHEMADAREAEAALRSEEAEPDG